ncbi:MAG: SusC/RagA family TonB-linked outer membrane protein [Bacteroidota bacterium]|nr:SusC/RagA family TonB-linked outer membrane protein [Bacteroidota bacterium]
MKLITVLLIVTCLQVSARGYSQKVTLKENNISLQKVFEQIRKETGYQFFYADEVLSTAKKVSLNIRKGSIEEVLDSSFKNQQLSYVISDKTIIVKRKVIVPEDDVLPISPPTAIEIKGKIVDEKGQPLEGATILVKGTNNGTKSDANGNFSIDAAPNSTLIISYVGFETTEVKVGNNLTLSVQLKRSVAIGDQIVVTALGISREKRSLGYSVAEINGDQLTTGGSANLVRSLDGKMSGVNFTQASTDPAGSVFITIRGATSLNLPSSTASSQPLFVIDGIPMGTTGITNKNGVDFGNLLSQLNPEDIQSISVLKGASAGALYGSQAGNGVVMITTKSGNGGKKGLGVSFNTSMVIDHPYNFYQTQTEFGTGIRSTFYVPGGEYDWGPRLDGSFNIWQWNTLTQAYDSVPFVAAKENRLQQYMQNGATNNYNVSVTGNSDKGSFRFSVGKMDNKGIMPNNKTDRMTLNLNADYNITKKVKVSISSNYVSQFSPNKSSSNNDVVEELTMDFLAVLPPIKQMQNIWLKGYEGVKQNAIQFRPNGDPAGDNPYMYTYGLINTYRKDNFFGKAQLEWQLAKPLKLLLRSGMDYNGDNFEYKLSKGWTDVNMREGAYSVEASNSFSVNSDIMLMWNKVFNKISTSATAGYNYVYGNSYDYLASAGKLVRANDFSLGNAVSGTLSSSNSWGIGKTQSGYATTQVGYDNQVYLDLSGRYDEGGILAEDKNHHFYPSAALSWIASQTLKLPMFINMFKLRGGVASVGHGIGRPRNTNTYNFNPVDYGAVKIVNIGGSLVDPNIKSEISTTYEGGFDLVLANNRVSADFTIFKKIHENQQDIIPVSPGTGYSGMLTNVGTIEAKGMEIGLTVVPIKTKNVNWDLSAYYTKVDAHVTKLSKAYVPNGYTFYGNGANSDIRLAEGERIGTMWANRVFQRMPSTSKYAGMPILDDQGNWKTSTNEKDRKAIGNYNPDFILGFNSSVRYKAFRLSVVTSLRMGGQYISDIARRAQTNGHSLLTIGDKVNGTNPYTAGGRDAASGGFAWPKYQDMQYPYMAALVYNYANYGAYAQDASYLKGVWLKPGGNANNDADYIVNGADPTATFWSIVGLVYGQQYWDYAETLIKDATNLKVKELSLECAVPSRFLENYKIQNLTIGLIARNIFQWNKSGEKGDPEAAFEGIGVNQGVIGKALPSIASYGFKFSVNF